MKFNLEAVEERAKEMKQLSEKKALKNVVSIHKAEDFKEQLASDKLVLSLSLFCFLSISSLSSPLLYCSSANII